MKKIASEYDQFTGITEETWYDEQTHMLTLKRFQDVDHILAMNKVQYNEHPDKATFNDVKNGFFKSAEIPLMVIEQWKQEGFDWYKSTAAEKRAKLNDGDYKKLRTRPGRL